MKTGKSDWAQIVTNLDKCVVKADILEGREVHLPPWLNPQNCREQLVQIAEDETNLDYIHNNHIILVDHLKTISNILIYLRKKVLGSLQIKQIIR